MSLSAEPRRSLPRRVLGRLAGASTVRKLAVSTPFVRDVAWRFVAGEDLAAGLATVRRLNARGIATSLSYVGTHVRDRVEAKAAADEVIAALHGIREAGVDANVSLKLTQVGLDIDTAYCRTLLDQILDAASASGVFVRIDMEESRYVASTIELFEEARERYGADRVGIVVQSYLRDHSEDLPRLVAGGSRIRLVKGGYWEAPDIVLSDRSEIDRAFLADIDTLLRGAQQPAIATHDPVAIEAVRRITAETGRDPRSFELQMLYGVRSDLQQALADEGFAVRTYVPYGGQWYAYVLGCVRRMPEGLLRELRQRTIGAGRSAGLGRKLGLAVKRGLDVTGAALALIVLSPVLLWAAVAVVASMGRPILFRQQRPGLHGRPFTILKLRTMRQPRPGEAWLWTDADRITRVGQLLRKTSIDELPELWNVVRGEMSLVGPRPLLIEYLPRYTPREARRHEMRPGITGWAATSGRHTVKFEDRLELDVWYVEHWDLALDLRIIWRTIGQVLGRSGVRATQSFDEIEFPERFQAAFERPDGTPAVSASTPPEP